MRIIGLSLPRWPIDEISTLYDGERFHRLSPDQLGRYVAGLSQQSDPIGVVVASTFEHNTADEADMPGSTLFVKNRKDSSIHAFLRAYAETVSGTCEYPASALIQRHFTPDVWHRIDATPDARSSPANDVGPKSEHVERRRQVILETLRLEDHLAVWKRSGEYPPFERMGILSDQYAAQMLNHLQERSLSKRLLHDDEFHGQVESWFAWALGSGWSRTCGATVLGNQSGGSLLLGTTGRLQWKWEFYQTVFSRAHQLGNERDIILHAGAVHLTSRFRPGTFKHWVIAETNFHEFRGPMLPFSSMLLLRLTKNLGKDHPAWNAYRDRQLTCIKGEPWAGGPCVTYRCLADLLLGDQSPLLSPDHDGPAIDYYAIGVTDGDKARMNYLAHCPLKRESVRFSPEATLPSFIDWKTDTKTAILMVADLEEGSSAQVRRITALLDRAPASLPKILLVAGTQEYMSTKLPRSFTGVRQRSQRIFGKSLCVCYANDRVADEVTGILAGLGFERKDTSMKVATKLAGGIDIRFDTNKEEYVFASDDERFSSPLNMALSSGVLLGFDDSGKLQEREITKTGKRSLAHYVSLIS